MAGRCKVESIENGSAGVSVANSSADPVPSTFYSQYQRDKFLVNHSLADNLVNHGSADIQVNHSLADTLLIHGP